MQKQPCSKSWSRTIFPQKSVAPHARASAQSSLTRSCLKHLWQSSWTRLRLWRIGPKIQQLFYSFDIKDWKDLSETAVRNGCQGNIATQAEPRINSDPCLLAYAGQNGRWKENGEIAQWKSGTKGANYNNCPGPISVFLQCNGQTNWAIIIKEKVSKLIASFFFITKWIFLEE